MKVAAIEHALPSREVGNEELIQRILARANGGIDPAKRVEFESAVRRFFERTGACTRRHRAPGERAYDFGIAAARGALERAGWAPDDVDLLIYVGVGRGCIEPATAHVFNAGLDLRRAACFDILDACASWLRAFDVARHMLHAGTIRRALILNCEFNFDEYIRWDFRDSGDLARLGAGFTVGEAATATLLEGVDEDEYHVSFRTRSDLHGLCRIPLPNAQQYEAAPETTAQPPLGFYSQAYELNASAIAMLERQFWDDPALAGGRYDLAVGHATSVPSRDGVMRRLKLAPAHVLDTFPRYGNTVSASLPLGLSIAAREGTLERGHLVLMIVGSAGVTTGLCRFRY
ncbi:MAG TPA: 3-oxoacyl-[acyl-carrier-protein] synthase III C-terminal domain-containing protein [Terriglobales bacterium]|nr:3-oxoacyl-[acyl-carrier-protein] synthase III C-terminal domain-containing protein [Terriglobales bacterium]